MVECLVWDQDAAGSSPVTSTIEKGMSSGIPFSIITNNEVTGYGFAQPPSIPLLGGRNLKATVKKTVRWTVFREREDATMGLVFEPNKRGRHFRFYYTMSPRPQPLTMEKPLKC